MTRVMLPQHLQLLATAPREVHLQITGPVTTNSIITELEKKHPPLRGCIREHSTHKRRPMVRFFACEEDISLNSPDEILPEKIANGTEPFYIIGAIAGG